MLQRAKQSTSAAKAPELFTSVGTWRCPDDNEGSGRSISPPPVSGGGRFELPAYLSNGIVGLRVSEVALTGGIAMVSGFSGEDPVKQIEAAVRRPTP